MKVKFLQQAIIETAAFHIGQSYDLHPTLAKGFISHGTAELAEGEQEEADELVGIPYADVLYSKGIKTIKDINLGTLATMEGFNIEMAQAIDDAINGVVVECLPNGTPYAKSLELAGYNTAAKVLENADAITCLSHLQLIEVVSFLEALEAKEVIDVTEKGSEGKEVIEAKKTTKKK